MKKLVQKIGKLDINVFDTRLEMGQAAARDAAARINRFVAESIPDPKHAQR
jgi:hypothetical protein